MSAAALFEVELIQPGAALPALYVPAVRLIDALLAVKSEATRRTYGKDLRAFAQYVQNVTAPDAEDAPDVEAVARGFASLGQGAANSLVVGWIDEMQRARVAPASINRRLSVVRSLLRRARQLGLSTLTIDVDGVRHKPYRDTAGPGLDSVAAMIRACQRIAKDGTPIHRLTAVRDLALLRLMFDLGLRRSEVCGLDLAHVDLAGGALSILGKGRGDRERVTLAPETAAALRAWIGVRGGAPGPLFVGRVGSPERLTGGGLWAVVRRLGKAAGLAARVWPHGLRHSSVTTALGLADGNVRTVRHFSRHASIETVLRYDDCRTDAAGAVSRMVAARLDAATAGV